MLGEAVYLYSRTDSPVPFANSGTFARKDVPGQIEVDWVNTRRVDVVARNYYTAVTASVDTVDRHYEEGDAAKASEQYTVNGDVNIRFVTQIKFPVPAVMALNGASKNPKTTMVTIEITARWPTRGGGYYNSVLVDLAKVFAESHVTRPTGGSGGLTYRLTVFGVTRVWQALSDFFTLRIDWTTNSWYEGEDSFGFDVNYSISYLDTEVRLGNPSLLEKPETNDGDDDDSYSLLGEWSEVSLEEV